MSRPGWELFLGGSSTLADLVGPPSLPRDGDKMQRWSERPSRGDSLLKGTVEQARPGLDLMPSSGARVVPTGKAQGSAMGSDLAGLFPEPIRGCPTCHRLPWPPYHGSISVNFHMHP